jgi:hypothetical protein
MLKICPEVDFYISATAGLINALHIPDFHKSWTEQGLIKAQDFAVEILRTPKYQSISHAPTFLKNQIREKYIEHLKWLRPQDPLQRATVGFESAIKFMDATDNTHLLPEFWQRTKVLDALRNEELLQVIPELWDLI